MSLSLPTPSGIAGWLAAYAAGARPAELLSRALERAASNSPPGTWIQLAEPARLAAQMERLAWLARDEAPGEALFRRLPLYGVPFAVKDNIDIADVPTTAACPAFSRRAAVTAHAVQRLLDAGGIWLGKTNLDQFATGLVGTRTPYGRPASVFSPLHISGGSSSGSAVAVAAGLVPFALGTDTAGSGRVPAGFNQIVGLKPTPGRVSTAGVLPACRSIDCVSVFSLSVADAEHVLAVIEGDDPQDGYSVFRKGPATWSRARLRVGIPRALRLAHGGEYARCFAQCVDRLKALGHEAVPVDFTPLHQVATMLYEGPWVAERAHAAGDLLAQAPESFDPTVRLIIGRAAGFSALEAFRSQYELRDLGKLAMRLWEEADLLMVPTAPRHPTFAEVDADPLGVNSELGTYTNFVNLLGWCAMALPGGRVDTGLPFGITFIAPQAHDVALAAFCRAWEAATPLSPAGAAPVDTPWPGADAVPLRRAASEALLPVAVVGAHLSGLPLNGQLVERGARLREATRTAPAYRLYALPGGPPMRPGLVRVGEGGSAIAVEVWELPAAQFGAFMALVPAPLGIGRVELADGSQVHGFLCEGHAVRDARDISAHGGWRAWLAACGT